MGTVKFGSINTHRGIEQSRRDDLESLVYCIYYFLKGKVPWDGVQAKTKKEKYVAIMEMKLLFQEELATIEKRLSNIYDYVRRLSFNETPDYCFIKSELTEIAKEKGISLDYVYDWLDLSEEGSCKSETDTAALNSEKKGGLKITFGKNKFLNNTTK